MNVISLFSGIGAFEKALTNLDIDYNVVNYCEFDKYASESYSAIHNIDKSLNLGDITQVDITKLEKNCADLITYGFPCQDISSAGKQKGFEDENGTVTRSGLFFNAASIIGQVQPKIAIAENVKALTSKKFEKEFKTVLNTLESLGYNNYYKVLNATDYKIPQNRERVFIISIRKDIDNQLFEFPQPFNLEQTVEDFLELEVDEKYYLSEKMINYISATNEKWTGNNNGALINKTIASTLNTKEGSRRCDASNYICKDLPNNYNLQKHNFTQMPRIRKLTPKECYCLMGFNEEDFYKSKQALNTAFYYGHDRSNSQLYKQAGNSIVVNVLMEIFKQLTICKLI
jgi:DNA (cytosine-5)-methyltransferase 1